MRHFSCALPLLLLLSAVAATSAQSCGTCTLTPCAGYGACSGNSDKCYTDAFCTNYTSADGDIQLMLQGAPPNVIKGLEDKIQEAVKNAYNTFCKSGENYKKCCPGATGINGSAAALVAMETIAEVEIPVYRGSSSKTVLILRLRPKQGSPLCSAATYPSTTTTTAATTAAATTAAATTAAGTTGTATTGTGTTAAPTTGTGTTAAPTTGTGTTAAGATTVAGTTAAGTTTAATTAAATTAAATTAAETTMAATTAARRRRREAVFEELFDEELSRSRRAVAVPTITLSADAISTIKTGMNIETVVTTTLSSQNVTVTVTVTVVGASSPAARTEPSQPLLLLLLLLPAALLMGDFRKME